MSRVVLKLLLKWEPLESLKENHFIYSEKGVVIYSAPEGTFWHDIKAELRMMLRIAVL